MKTRIRLFVVGLALLSALDLQLSIAFAQSTAFTYQGRLTDGGAPAIRASGGVGIGVTNPTGALQVHGTVTATSFAGSGAGLTNVNAATFGGVGASNYWQLGGNGLGADDKHIATVDADGVALAAIQGLNEKVEVRSQKSEISIQKLQAENAELKQRLEKLERLMNQQSGGAK